jgi:hypothetical protein
LDDWRLVDAELDASVELDALVKKGSGALQDSGALPGAENTRQRLLCTRQSLCRVQHSAKSRRQKVSRQRFLCRVLFIGHSAKTLPSANPAPGKEKWTSRRRLHQPKYHEYHFLNNQILLFHVPAIQIWNSRKNLMKRKKLRKYSSKTQNFLKF